MNQLRAIKNDNTRVEHFQRLHFGDDEVTSSSLYKDLY